MRRHWTWTIGISVAGTMVTLAGAGMQLSAQENNQRDTQQKQEGQNSDAPNRSERSSGTQGDPEVRLNYDDSKNRLSIDVDDEIQFENDSSRRDVLRDGEIGLRYDRDNNYLRTSGDGTIDVDRAVSQMGRWWQSWWDDERQARRGRTEGSAMGAGEFIRQYDDNSDQRLTRRELPPHMRDIFNQLDRDGDNYVSRTELSQYGERYFDQRNRSSTGQQYSNTAQNSENERSWSQWWSSWWSDDQSGGSQQERATTGSRRLLQTYDQNDDGYLSKSELPLRMREDFDFVDRNSDGYISRNEVQQYGYALRTPTREREGTYAGTYNTGQANFQSQTRSSSQREYDDSQTWSQWWSSWWSDEESGDSNQEIASNGARQFLRQYDDNNDDMIVRSEMPTGMYDEFQSIDTNNDRRLSREEISAYATRTGQQLPNRSRQQNRQQIGAMANSRDRSSDPINTAYVWVIDANHGHLKREDLQEAYSLFRKLDTNSDGEISQSELEKHRGQIVSEWCEKCFEKLDQNGDGRLTRNEAQDSMFADRFEEYDRNDDSRLSKSEAQQGVQNQLESQRAASTQAAQSSR